MLELPKKKNQMQGQETTFLHKHKELSFSMRLMNTTQRVSDLECGYDGGVENVISSDDKFVLLEFEDGEEWDSDELSEYDGNRWSN